MHSYQFIYATATDVELETDGTQRGTGSGSAAIEHAYSFNNYGGLEPVRLLHGHAHSLLYSHLPPSTWYLQSTI